MIEKRMLGPFEVEDHPEIEGRKVKDGRVVRSEARPYMFRWCEAYCPWRMDANPVRILSYTFQVGGSLAEKYSLSIYPPARRKNGT